MGDAPRKLCVATPEFPPLRWGGLAATVEKVAGHAAGLGYETHVAHLQVREGPLPLLDENRTTRRHGQVTVHDILAGRERPRDRSPGLWDCPQAMTLLMMFQSLELLHARERFDAFLSFFVYPVGYVTGLLARKSGRPHVACTVGNDVRKYVFSPEKAALVRSGLENATCVVALSRDLMDLAHALTPVRDRTSVIFNSVDLPEAWAGNRPAREAGTPLRLGCAAIFKYAKGLPYLLKALALLRARHPVRLELAGEFRPEEGPVFEALADRCGVRDLVDFAGVVPRQDMPAWLTGLNAYVLPSVSEGCPNVLMEAMACGLPCVAARVGAVEDLVEHGVSGLVVPPGDSAGLAAALDRILADPALGQRLGRAARQRMREFSPARERREWQAVLETALGG